jgi:membrane protein
MYLSWAVVLLGAILTAALGEWRSGVRRTREMGRPEERLEAALDMLFRLRQESRTGREVSRERMMKDSGLDGLIVDGLLADFQRAGYADRTQRHGWALIRDLSAVSLYDFMCSLGVAIRPADMDLPSVAWRQRLRASLDDMANRQRQSAALSLADLLDANNPTATDEPVSPMAARNQG